MLRRSENGRLDDPTTEAQFGDGALMTARLPCCGWDAVGRPRPRGTMRMEMPIARRTASRLTGDLRGNFILNERAKHRSVADRAHQLSVLDPASART